MTRPRCAKPMALFLQLDTEALPGALGESLGRVAAAGDLVCLWGDLGAGKTQLAKGFGAGLGVTDTLGLACTVLTIVAASMAALTTARVPKRNIGGSPSGGLRPA